jgi:hypothetical protein
MVRYGSDTPVNPETALALLSGRVEPHLAKWIRESIKETECAETLALLMCVWLCGDHEYRSKK